MKPLLRVVMIIDALVLFAFGLLFVLTPWAGLYDALHLVRTEPALVAQAFGIALFGLAWLALHASFSGALTTSVARAVGHVNWLSAVLMLVWLLGLHKPGLTGFGQLVAVAAAVVLLVLGLGSVRLAGAVRRRERARLNEAAASERAARQAQRQETREATRREAVPVTVVEPAFGREPSVTPVGPAVEPAPSTATRDAARDAADPPRPPHV